MKPNKAKSGNRTTTVDKVVKGKRRMQWQEALCYLVEHGVITVTDYYRARRQGRVDLEYHPNMDVFDERLSLWQDKPTAEDLLVEGSAPYRQAVATNAKLCQSLEEWVAGDDGRRLATDLLVAAQARAQAQEVTPQVQDEAAWWYGSQSKVRLQGKAQFDWRQAGGTLRQLNRARRLCITNKK